MNKKIVTNLRIDEQDWLQVKAIATDRGLSVNEYLSQLIVEASNRRQLGLPMKDSTKKKKLSFWDLPERLKHIKAEPMGELSEDDKIIYET